MRNQLAFVIALASSALFVACGDDGGEPGPVDASGSGSADAPAQADAAIDAAGTVCTGELYDSCTDNTDCDSANCRMFNMPSPGIRICTQQCSNAAPCPQQNGAAVECTNAGVCRPSAANTCTAPT